MTDTGWHSPTGVVNQGGLIINPGNAFTSDDQYATRTGFSDGKEEPTGQLILKELGFAIPETDIILGVEVKVEGKKSGNVRSQALYLTTNGTGGTGTNKQAGVVFGSIDTESVVGGPMDTWGVPGGLTPAIVNSANFGVAYQIRMYSSSTWYLDAVSVRVYHEPSSVNEFEVSGDLDILLTGDGRHSNAYRRAARLVRSIFPQRFSRR